MVTASRNSKGNGKRAQIKLSEMIRLIKGGNSPFDNIGQTINKVTSFIKQLNISQKNKRFLDLQFVDIQEQLVGIKAKILAAEEKGDKWRESANKAWARQMELQEIIARRK